MWFRESSRYFCKIENFAYGEISERRFSNPHPWTIRQTFYRGRFQTHSRPRKFWNFNYFSIGISFWGSVDDEARLILVNGLVPAGNKPLTKLILSKTHDATRCYLVDISEFVTEKQMSSFWRNFNHWLHWKSSFRQLPMQPVIKISSNELQLPVRPVIKISSKWHFCCSGCVSGI